VQRRVYDALNVLSAMDIIHKDKYNIIYNHTNKYIPTADTLAAAPEVSSEQCLQFIKEHELRRDKVRGKQQKLIEMV
jgi:hypothetical protein